MTLTERLTNIFKAKTEVLQYRVSPDQPWRVYRKFRTEEEKEQFIQKQPRNKFIEFK